MLGTSFPATCSRPYNVQLLQSHKAEHMSAAAMHPCRALLPACADSVDVPDSWQRNKPFHWLQFPKDLLTLNGATPDPAAIMMMGAAASKGSLKEGWLTSFMRRWLPAARPQRNEEQKPWPTVLGPSAAGSCCWWRPTQSDSSPAAAAVAAEATLQAAVPATSYHSEE